MTTGEQKPISTLKSVVSILSSRRYIPARLLLCLSVESDSCDYSLRPLSILIMGNLCHAQPSDQHFSLQEAFKSGRKAEAKQLSDKGKQEGKLMEEANHKASDAVFQGEEHWKG